MSYTVPLRTIGYRLNLRFYDEHRLLRRPQLCQVAIDSGALVVGQTLDSDPFSPADTGEVPMRARRAKVRVQDRLNEVFQARPLAY